MAQAMQRQDESAVQASMKKLSVIYREVLLLRFQEEMQLEEIAAVTSIPLSTVKSRLYRGLEGLRGALHAGQAGLAGGAA